MSLTITLTLSTEALLLGHELVSALRSVAEAMASRAVPAVAAEGANLLAPAAGGSPAPEMPPDVLAGIMADVRKAVVAAIPASPLPISSPVVAAPPTRPRPVTPAPEAIGVVSSSQTAPAVASVTPAAFSEGTPYVPTKWTEERKAVLRRMYPSGAWPDEIVAALNELPGDPVTKQQATGYATGMGLRRQPGTPATAPVASAPPPAPTPAPAPPPRPAPPPPTARPAVRPPSAPPAGRMDILRQVAASRGEPVRADFLTVSAWAAPRGLRCDTRADLPAVNAKRLALGLPAFVLPETGART